MRAFKNENVVMRLPLSCKVHPCVKMYFQFFFHIQVNKHAKESYRTEACDCSQVEKHPYRVALWLHSQMETKASQGKLIYKDHIKNNMQKSLFLNQTYTVYCKTK